MLNYIDSMNQHIRAVKKEDLNALKVVIDSSELFPNELLDDMIADFFEEETSEAIWLTTIEDDQPISIAFCAPEEMTDGAYNLYLIAVHKTHQGKGVGGKMMEHLERQLREDGQRILLVETSSLPEYELTRQFYLNLNYHQEAVIRDFYQEGEDKVVFWKKLTDLN